MVTNPSMRSKLLQKLLKILGLKRSAIKIMPRNTETLKKSFDCLGRYSSRYKHNISQAAVIISTRSLNTSFLPVIKGNAWEYETIKGINGSKNIPPNTIQ